VKNIQLRHCRSLLPESVFSFRYVDVVRQGSSLLLYQLPSCVCSQWLHKNSDVGQWVFMTGTVGICGRVKRCHAFAVRNQSYDEIDRFGHICLSSAVVALSSYVSVKSAEFGMCPAHRASCCMRLD